VNQKSGLLTDGLDNPGMGVSKSVDPDAGNQVEISLSASVVRVTTFATVQNWGNGYSFE